MRNGVDAMPYINALNKQLTQAEKEQNATWIYGYFHSLGWSLNAICGMLGNFQAESTLNPNVYEGFVVHQAELGNYGYGLAQWTPWLGKIGSTVDEQRNYHGTNNPTFGRWCLDNARDKSLMETQCDYLNLGLGGYKKNDDFPDVYLPFNEFKISLESSDYLAKVFYRCYERSKSGSYGQRPQYAMQWYEFLSGAPVPQNKPHIWLLFQFNKRRILT